VVDRPGWRLKALSSPAAGALWRHYVPEQRARLLPEMRPPAWTFLTGPLSPLSSTELRARQKLAAFMATRSQAS
ncbi:MAG: nicotinic acid mononucleotide adenylyltransferase, partial [Hyphomicrobiaceae bacterium]|nr:nicotinic acid mononucleotide adenylyltransferase [Hyphomicrobiaceae bacterium]